MFWNRKAAHVESRGGRAVGRLRVPDELLVRLGAAVLWTVVAVAAVGGVVAWWRPAPAPVVVPSDAAEEVEASWAVAGFAERFVAGWLTDRLDSAEQGYAEEPVEAEESGGGGERETHDGGATAVPAGSVRAVEVSQLGAGSWAVTVAVPEVHDPLGEPRFWRAGVVFNDGGLEGAGWPTPVAVPARPERVDRLAVGTLGAVPADDEALVEAVEGFVLAHACGVGPLERWLAPGVKVEPVEPPVCEEAELQRWADGSGDGGLTVVVEVLLEGDAIGEREVSYALVVADRDGRWEVDALLPALPVDEEDGSS